MDRLTRRVKWVRCRRRQSGCVGAASGLPQRQTGVAITFGAIFYLLQWQRPIPMLVLMAATGGAAIIQMLRRRFVLGAVTVACVGSIDQSSLVVIVGSVLIAFGAYARVGGGAQ